MLMTLPILCRIAVFVRDLPIEKIESTEINIPRHEVKPKT